MVAYGNLITKFLSNAGVNLEGEWSSLNFVFHWENSLININIRDFNGVLEYDSTETFDYDILQILLYKHY